MNILLLLSATASPIKITHNIRSGYLHKNPIIISFRIENTSDDPIQIPDLSYQTWRTSFVLTSPNRKETRSNERKTEEPTWTIPPHGARLLTMEVPGSNTLSNGTYTLSVQIDYSHDQYQQTQEISIHPIKTGYVETNRSIHGELSAIWTEENTDGTYYHLGSSVEYLHKKTKAPQLIVHPNPAPYDFDIQNRDIHIRGKQERNAVIPYPDAIPLSRISLYKDQYHLPFWIPQSKKLMLLHLNQKGVPSYRHVRSDTPQIIKTAVTQTAQGIPLYLLQHSDGVELLRVDPPKNPTWPINSQYVYKTTSEETILFSQFQLHEQEGIVALLISKEKESWYRIWVSLSGSIIHKEPIISFPKAAIIDAYQSAILLTNQKGLLLVDEKGQHQYPKRENCRINKNGLFCFTNGKWESLATSISGQ